MILYITRKFPPSIGGMQRFNFKFVNSLKKIADVDLIAWGGGQIILPFFVLFALLKSFYACLTKPISYIYIADGLLSPLGYFLKLITRKPVIVTIHGKDIAFSLKIYQIVIPWCLRRVDKVVCVSNKLKEECRIRGVKEEKLLVIPNGVDIEDFQTQTIDKSREFTRCVGHPLNNRKILLTVGRLVPKKGIDSFIKNILPRII